MDTLVAVLIPRPLLADVYELVVEHERVDLDDVVEEPAPLDEALIRRMFEESEPQHRRLMKLLANRPDEWIYTSAIAEALELPHGSRSAAGMCGAFGRRAAHRYGGAKPWLSQQDKNAGENRHMMSAAVASTINQL